MLTQHHQVLEATGLRPSVSQLP